MQTNKNSPLVVVNSMLSCLSLALRIPRGAAMSLTPFQTVLPASETDAKGAGCPPSVGFGTRIVAPATPTGKVTESRTVCTPLIVHEVDISPLGERYCPPTDLGPTLSWMRGAIVTFAKPGAAGAMPAKCFHIQWLIPPQRKMWFNVSLSAATKQQQLQ